MSGRVVVIDDDEAMCTTLEKALTKKGYEVLWHTRAEDAQPSIEGAGVDAVLTDLNLPGISGIELCERLADSRPDLPVVVITAFGSMDSAIAAIRAGAFDFITKPIDLSALGIALDRAVSHGKLKTEVRELRERALGAPRGDLIGESAPMRRLYDLLERIGESDTTVLITGESGAGKELAARRLHQLSDRKGEFVAVNCAAMPATLLESELFGHVRGAFTDARSDRDGLFVRADGGTLLLDEIGEMALAMQPKLLRVLQESRVRPVGADADVSFDTRIIAATNRDLESRVEQGTFREDLFYRINVVTVHMPALRSRGKDTLLLAQHFLNESAQRLDRPIDGISPEAAQKLLDYDWPGNVRELQNCLERAVTLTRHGEIVVADLPETVRQHQSRRWVIDSDDPEELVTLEELERRYVQRVLQRVDGNKTQAAKILGVDRRTLYRKLERFGD